MTMGYIPIPGYILVVYYDLRCQSGIKQCNFYSKGFYAVNSALFLTAQVIHMSIILSIIRKIYDLHSHIPNSYSVLLV